MGCKVDCSEIRTVRIYKEQFNAIDKKATAILLECKEDGRVIRFDRTCERPEYADNDTEQRAITLKIQIKI